MKRSVDVLNTLGCCVALACAIYGGSLSTGRGLPDVTREARLAQAVTPEVLSDGTRVVRDATFTPVPLTRYTRIASGTLIADRVLSDLCDPTRIVAFTSHGAANAVYAHRLAGKPHIAARAPVETILALKPDLLSVNNLIDPGYVSRLREHGVRVFDLGHMRGLQTLLAQIRTIGLLIGEEARAEQYAQSLARRMARVAQDRAGAPRPRALYLTVFGDRLYGGAAESSYHDVMVHAGLRDVAAEAGLEGWPELDSERVLALDPEVLVTRRGMGAVLCRHAGLSQLRPCRGEGRLVELEGALLDDPGPTMLEATEALYDALWREEPKLAP